MKEVALQRRAHTSLGQDVSDFVRKRVEALKMNSGRNLERHIKDEIAALVGIDKDLPKNVSDFLDYVQSKLKKEDHDIAIAKVRKRDEIKNLMPKFER